MNSTEVGLVLFAISVLIVSVIGVVPAAALFSDLSEAEAAKALEFGLSYPATRWPGTDSEWQKEVLIRLDDLLRFRTIQVTFLTPWLRLAIAAWERPFVYGDPSSPATSELVRGLRSRLLIQVWFVPRQPREPGFQSAMEAVPVSLSQSGKTFPRLTRRKVECQTARWPGCVATELEFNLELLDVTVPLSVDLSTGGEGYQLVVDPSAMR
ncbi:MAG: hypothetical protein HY334_08195 [Armatimonadetes bacterium]|nr:hypothetical protein [Armatimonadota bacterium]